MVVALGVWGQRWTRRQLADGEVDVSLLAWSLERSVDAEAFGPGGAVVRFEFPDQPKAKRYWWFVNRGGEVELCLEDPGHEVDLYLTVTVRDLIYIVRGDLALGRALEDGRLEAIGPRALRARLRAWFNLSPLARVRSQRPEGAMVTRAA